MTLAELAVPTSLLILLGSYGSDAVLPGELTPSWQKGLASTLVLGAVCGMSNEAMARRIFLIPTSVPLSALPYR